MELKDLIRKRIDENVPNYDKAVIERYEYLFEMVVNDYKEQSSIVIAPSTRELIIAAFERLGTSEITMIEIGDCDKAADSILGN